MRSAGGSEWADADAVASLPEQSAVYSADNEVRRTELELPLSMRSKVCCIVRLQPEEGGLDL